MPDAASPRHSVSVAAAIFDDAGENVLLIKRRDNGRWEPPGGVLELDETVKQGLRREVHEETGANIEVGPLTGVYKNIPRGVLALVFRCSLKDEHLAATPEAQQINWRRVDRLGDMVPAYSIRILDALVTPPSGPFIRSHDGVHIMPDAPEAATQ